MNDSVSELLSDLEAVLSRLSLRWYLFGAQAVNVWGRPRMTADVDVTVEDPGAQREELLAALEAAGFSPLVPAESLVDAPTVPLRHDASGLPLDVVLGTSGLEKRFFARAIPTLIGDVSVPVVAPATSWCSS